MFVCVNNLVSRQIYFSEALDNTEVMAVRCGCGIYTLPQSNTGITLNLENLYKPCKNARGCGYVELLLLVIRLIGVNLWQKEMKGVKSSDCSGDTPAALCAD